MVLPVLDPARRDPTEAEREDPDEDRADHERRDRDPQPRHQHRGVVGRGVVAHGRNDPERDADPDGDQHREQADAGGGGKEVGDDLADTPGDVLVRRTEVEAGYDRGQVVDVLLRQRLVEPVLAIELLLGLLRDGPLAIPRPARRDVIEAEGQRVEHAERQPVYSAFPDHRYATAGVLRRQ